MSFLDGVISSFTGGGILSSVVKIAGLAFVASQVAKSATASNNVASPASPANIDAGIRLQIPPASDHKVPVLYGTAFFSGNITDAIMSNNNKTMTYCLTLCEKTGSKLSDSQASVTTFKDIYWNDQRIVFNSDGITVNYTVDRDSNVDRSLSGLVKIRCYDNGSSHQATPENYTLSTSTVAYTAMPGWTSYHTMNNLSFAIVEVNYNRDKNLTGLGTLLFEVSNSMNLPGDCLYDYMTNTRYGAGIDSGEILASSATNYYRTLTYLNAMSVNNLQFFDQTTSANQILNDTFQINGLLDCAQPVMKNIEKICSASGSWLSYDIHEGKWGIVMNNSYDTSSASFTDRNIIGNISLSGTGLQNLYNSVKVEFPHRELKDSSDFVTIAIPSYERNANEEDNVLNLTYDIINDPIQAQYLGMIELKQSRIDLVISFETDFSYIGLKAGDIIDVTNTRFGFNAKKFRIITVTEVHDNAGLKAQITALEYNSNVYLTTDLYKYTRTDTNGIISIGNIGVPGTPQVTKYEVDSRPHVVIETTAPTGVIEGIEYWLTKDTGQLEANRSYTLIATKKPTGGGVFAGGTTVSIDYDQLDVTDFYIKTRAFNSTTVGPFSNPSGLIEYVPVQTAGAIDDNTQLLGGNGIIPGLGLLFLLSSLNDLFGNDNSKGLFGKIFDTFKTETGVDLVDQANNGTIGGGTGSADEDWTYDSSTIESITIDGVDINRFTSITFERPNGSKVTLNITFP